MKPQVVIALLLGIVIGQSVPVSLARAQSATEPMTRVVRALEDIAETLKRIERRHK